jgi:hypothetical protein
MSCCLGRASVNMRGSKTMKPINAISRRMANVVVRPRFVFNLPPDSRRLSSNIRVSPYYRAYVNLDTVCFPFAPKLEPHRPSRPPKPRLALNHTFQPTINKGLIKHSQSISMGPSPDPDGHGNRPLALFDSPILISHQDRRRDCDRRICSDQDANYQRQAETAQHLAAEQIECKYGKEG